MYFLINRKSKAVLSIQEWMTLAQTKLLKDYFRDCFCFFSLEETRLAQRMIDKFVEAEQLYGTELTVVAHAGLQLAVANTGYDGFAFRCEFCFQFVCGKGQQLFQSYTFIGRILLYYCFYLAVCRRVDDLLTESEE